MKKKSTAAAWVVIMLLVNAIGTLAYSQSIAVLGSDHCAESSISSHVRRIRELLSTKGGNVMTEAEMITKLGGIATISMADANRALVASRDDLLSMAYTRATLPLELIIKELYLLPPSQKRCESLRDAYSKLAWAYRKQGKEKECVSSLSKMTSVGSFDLDYDLFPPSFHKFAENLRKEAQGKANTKLRITTRPSGLTIHVNGCPVGAAPMNLALPPGEYLVEAAFLTGRGIPKKVVVSENKADTVEFDQGFEGSIFADRGPCFTFRGHSKNRLTQMARLSSLLEADSVVALREEEVTKGDRYLVASLLEGSKDSREARIKLPAGGASNADIEKLAAFIASGNATPPVEEMGVKNDWKPTISQHSAVVSKPSKWKRTAAWSLAGLTAVLGTVAVVEMVRVNNLEKQMKNYSPDGAGLQGNTLPEYEKRRSSSKTAATWGTVAAIGAGAAAIGSGTLFWLSLRPSISPSALASSPRVGFALGGDF